MTLQTCLLLFLTWLFPYVSQLGPDADLYVKDCGSAAIAMVTEYYGVAGDETVNDIHLDLIGEDKGMYWPPLAAYLEDEYNLETQAVVNYYIIDNPRGIIEPEFVTEIPDDVPVIWLFATYPHWVVRYQGWSYDPWFGIYEFEIHKVHLTVY